MREKVYSCEADMFSSNLSGTFRSFVEYKVNVSGCVPESFTPVLKRFDRYCCDLPNGAAHLDTATVLGFVSAQNTKNSTASRQASVLRSLGKYTVAVLGDKDAFVIPKLVKRTGKTFVPYVFSFKEISLLIGAAESYCPKIRNKPTVNILNCMKCIIIMLYCTGMRVSEVSDLSPEDVDIDQGIIYVNHAKNDNHRIVTMSNSLRKACHRYLEESSRHTLSGIYFFDSGSPHGDGRVSRSLIYSYFRRFLSLAGIEHKGNGFGPRLHDLRVTFAVHSLKRLSEENDDVNSCLYYLSVYMGHQSLQETQDYLWLTSETFSSILKKMDAYTSFITGIFDRKAGDMTDE